MAQCGFTAAGTCWEKMEKTNVEAILTQHYGNRRIHIHEGDDLEQVIRHIIMCDLGDFCWSLDFGPHFIGQLFSHGFLPICSVVSYGCGEESSSDDDSGDGSSTIDDDAPSDVSGKISVERTNRKDPAEQSHQCPQPLYVLLPKLHRSRCVLQNLSDIRIDRGARKRSRHYHLTVDTAFSRVMHGCIEQHGESWLWPPMQKSFIALFDMQKANDQTKWTANVETLNAPCMAPSSCSAIHSVELWTADGRLVAGELGFTCGAMYTSLTGFYREGGTGMVQMLALAGLLLCSGFQSWDLGMNLDYKQSFGALDLNRADFVQMQRRLRCFNVSLLPAALLPEGIDAQELIKHIVRARANNEIGVVAGPNLAVASGSPNAIKERAKRSADIFELSSQRFPDVNDAVSREKKQL